MTMYEIGQFIYEHSDTRFWIVIALIATYMIDISKIKLNPWKWIGNLLKKCLRDIGNILTEDIRNDLANFKEQYNVSTQNHISEYTGLYDKLDNLENTINKVNDKLNNHIAESLRRDILDFQNSCINKRRHTKEEWTYIYKMCDKYENHIEENHLKNSEAEEAIGYIRHIYRECLENGEFLISSQPEK